jgi:hypothetical protein
MGQLDDKTYAAMIAGCAKCDRKSFEVWSYMNREIAVMLSEPNADGRWINDDAMFVEGIYKIRCIGCGAEPYASDACPRCGRRQGLAEALATSSHLSVPRMCPRCKITALTCTASAPARIRTGGGKATAPTPIARFGEPGFHIVKIVCDACDWSTGAAGCPVCAGPATQSR